MKFQGIRSFFPPVFWMAFFLFVFVSVYDQIAVFKFYEALVDCLLYELFRVLFLFELKEIFSGRLYRCRLNTLPVGPVTLYPE